MLPGPIDTGMMARIGEGSATTPVGGGTLLAAWAHPPRPPQ
ncbi:hypothetical protein ACL02T_15785 [Pseudonocardia sp. RS010]